MLLLSLDAIGRLPELVDRLLQALLDVLVRGHTGRQRDRAAPAEELVVDLASGLERVADVVPQVLVGDGALEVRTRSTRLVQ